MKNVLTSAQMKFFDQQTIRHYGVPSLVLMERAALAVYEEALRLIGRENARILIVAGTGNNGADALAAGRMLFCCGHLIHALIVGDTDNASAEFKTQHDILNRMQILVSDYSKEKEAELDETLFGYDLIIDGLFGVGLNRALSGIFEDAVRFMQRTQNTTAADGVRPKLLAVDIVSVVSADDGTLLGPRIEADATVTFHAPKVGHLLYPGKALTGRLTVAKIGIIETPGASVEGVRYACYDEDVAALLPVRSDFSHKGDYGKLLLVAGSKDIGGCAILAAKAALRSGVGMVRVVTHAANRTALISAVPEALVDTYDDTTSDDALKDMLDRAFPWSDAAVIGPGIGTSDTAKTLLSHTLTAFEKGIVADADALNLLSTDETLRTLAMQYSDTEPAGVTAIPKDAATTLFQLRRRKKSLILTPHVAEFARLLHLPVTECRAHAATYPKALADAMHAVVLMKDAVCVTASDAAPECILNTTGNHGMATAGSGDVLAGIIGALLAYGFDAARAASVGAYLHGHAGDKAANALTPNAMCASDIITFLGS